MAEGEGGGRGGGSWQECGLVDECVVAGVMDFEHSQVWRRWICGDGSLSSSEMERM